MKAAQTVTGIEPCPGGKKYAVYLNDTFAFVLYKGELSKYGLETGTTVDDELYDLIMKETVFLRAKKRGMNLLKTMDRTEANIRMKLAQGLYPPGAIDEAVEYLKSYHYIDDSRYAMEYIRTASSSKSRRQIRMKLSEKGISKNIIEEAFAKYDEENGDSGEDAEKELIRKLINKRCPSGVASIEHTEKQKLFAYLYGKGFTVSAIESVYSDMGGL